MKFSYQLLKQLVPALKNPEHLRDLLSAHLFEVESIVGDTVDIKILPNRYSDAASHRGIARELSAMLGKTFALPKENTKRWNHVEGALDLVVKVEDKKLCPRYMARYIEIDSDKKSPEWMQKVLISCGMRPISAVVDIMNYVMLETGQPMHAFDADKVKGILVRRAKAGEKMETLDNQHMELSPEDLVIADGEHVLAIAGIKGGKRAEVTAKTTRIIVESANFDSVAIYKTSKRIKLGTDASARFSHNLSPALTEAGLLRATELLHDICNARVGEVVDVYPKKMKPATLKFSAEEFERITGLKLAPAKALEYLKRLGFSVQGGGANTRVTAPAIRMDIERFEDLTDEIVRLYGYDKLPATPPVAELRPAGHDESVKLKDLIRPVLTAAGLSEAYNYSFVSERDLARLGTVSDWRAIPLKNPVSESFSYMRPSLAPHLLKNVEDNFRFYDSVRLFEIGHVFHEEKSQGSNAAYPKERNALGMVIGSRKSNPVLELKGMVTELLERLGLTDYFLRDIGIESKFVKAGESLRIESDHHVLGYIGAVTPKIVSHAAICEIDLDELLKLVDDEREYEPLPKYPAVGRDISLFVGREVRVNTVLEAIQAASPKLVYDVDLIDYLEDDKITGSDKKSLAFRIVFQSPEKTLTDEEVGKEMEKIVSALKAKAGAEIR